jgi:predicted dehydrogenase
MVRIRRTLRLGLLGTGVAARKLYLPAFRALEGRVQVVACSSRNERKARAYAKLAGIPHVEADAHALFSRDDIDGIFISLPIDAQPEYVLEALRLGKPVLSEKPVGPTVAAARRLIKAAGRFDTPWLIGENFEYLPQVERLRSWIDQGRLGDVRLVEVNQFISMNQKNPYFKTPWRQDPKHIGGFVVDAGVHLAHIVRSCFGQPRMVKSLKAQFDAALPPVDTVVAALQFESGVLGTWRSCFCARHDGPMLEVVGSKANARLGYDWIELWSAGRGVRRYAIHKDTFALQLLHFREVALKRKRPAVTPQDALADLQLMDRLVR